MLLVHSSLKGTDIDADDFIEDLTNEYGTVMFPAFNWQWAETGKFDIRKTPSRMGILTEMARRRAIIRTRHPMYSFTVLGDKATQMYGIDNYSAFGAGSPFDILVENDGYIMAVNLPDNKCMTMVHHVEEMEGAGHREPKEFTGEYTDWDGDITTRTYMMNVRKPGVKTNPEGAQKLCEKLGLWNQVDKYIRVIKAQDYYRVIKDLIKNGETEGMIWEKE